MKRLILETIPSGIGYCYNKIKKDTQYNSVLTSWISLDLKKYFLNLSILHVIRNFEWINDFIQLSIIIVFLWFFLGYSWCYCSVRVSLIIHQGKVKPFKQGLHMIHHVSWKKIKTLQNDLIIKHPYILITLIACTSKKIQIDCISGKYSSNLMNFNHDIYKFWTLIVFRVSYNDFEIQLSIRNLYCKVNKSLRTTTYESGLRVLELVPK